MTYQKNREEERAQIVSLREKEAAREKLLIEALEGAQSILWAAKLYFQQQKDVPLEREYEKVAQDIWFALRFVKEEKDGK